MLDEAAPRELRFRCLQSILDIYCAHKLNFFVLRNDDAVLRQLEALK